MTQKANTSEARQKKREREYADNRRYWLSEEEKLYARWEEAYYPGGQDQVDRLIKQGKKPVR